MRKLCIFLMLSSLVLFSCSEKWDYSGARIIKENVNVEFKCKDVMCFRLDDTVYIQKKGDDEWILVSNPIIMKDSTAVDFFIRKAVITSKIVYQLNDMALKVNEWASSEKN